MRTRDTTMIDYGIDREREKQLCIFAKQEKYYSILEQAANAANPYLASYILDDLSSEEFRRGYRTLFRYVYCPPCTEKDFYAYRRKTLALFDRLLSGKPPVIPRIRKASM